MRARRSQIALLALPTLIDAVALSDFQPRATNLPPTCNNLYTASIDGCSASDFQSHTCSSGCISALEALVPQIKSACGNQGVSGENLVVAFLANVGPQQICPNAPAAATSAMSSMQSSAQPTTPSSTPTSEASSTTSPPSSTASPTVVSSTSTASSLSDTSSLLVDTSSSALQTSAQSTAASSSSQPQSTSAVQSSSSAAQTSSGGVLVGATSSSSQTSTGTATSTSSSSGNSQTNLHDGSGGGSPFDTQGNLSNTATGLSVSIASLLFSTTLLGLAALR